MATINDIMEDLVKKALVISTALFLISAFAVQASALCVKDDRANLRANPGTNYEKTWEVYKYMPFKQLGKRGSWYKVEDVDGDVHWIYGNLVTSKYKCAVVSNEEANIRSGPGTNYEKILYSPAPRYATFKVIQTSGEWVKIEDEYDNTGWIHKDLLWIQ